jgi:lactate dehydrogenase-like 2-hydroxyacid dehydrogenase
VYSLYKLDDQVRAHAEAHFDLVSPGDAGWEQWRTEAEGVMLRGETIDAEDVRQIGSKLRFVSKHGVGMDKVDVKGLRARGVTLMNTPGVNVSVSGG